MAPRLRVRTGASVAPEAAQMAGELAAKVAQSDAAVTFVFVSPRVELPAFIAALARALPGPVVGCTTAGEIGPAGFQRGGAVAMSLAGAVRFGYGVVRDLRRADFAAGTAALRQASRGLGEDLSAITGSSHVGLMLIDGLSATEEIMAASVTAAAPQLRLVGGSASDDYAWTRTHVFAGGEVASDAALVALLALDVPFALVKTEHATPTDEQLIVTEVDYATRRVLELNGRPARTEVARLCGVSPDAVNDDWVATHPFAMVLGSVPYLRSSYRVVGDALQMACAIDEGVVLRLTRRGDLVESTRAALDRARAQVQHPTGLIAFNCVGRHFDAEANGLTAPLGRVLAEQPVVGFNTYGEQYLAMHINYSLTGIYLGGGDGG